MFDRLKTIFRGRVSAKTQDAPKPEAKSGWKLGDIARIDKGGQADKGKADTKAQGPAKAPAKKSPEELCGITPKMGKEEIREKLAVLYRRYNRATSSLDTKLRAEAEEMLDAIVAIREKVFGPI
jgi:hypothetical protein